MNLESPLIIAPDARYAYATGLVRGKWERRADRSALYRLIDSSPANIGTTLAELGFAGAENDPEAAIAVAWEEVVRLVESLSQDPEITRVLRLFTDFTNAAIAVKSVLFDFDYAPLHLPGGNATAEDIRRAAEGENNIQSVPTEVGIAMKNAEKLYEATQIPIVIDVTMDASFGAMFVELLLSSEREFLVEYARRWADAKNFTSYLRLRLAELPIEHFKGFFIKGGYIKQEDFRLFEDMELDNIPSRLIYSPYGKPLADAVAHLVKEMDFSSVEAFFARVIEDFLRSNIYVAFGLEVVLSYAFLRWRELRAIGAITRLVEAGFSRERIIERVRYGDI